MRPRHLHPLGTGIEAEIAKEEGRLAASQGRLASLRRAAEGDTSDRVITVDAVWEGQGSRSLGAAVLIYQDRTVFFPGNVPGPEYLYAAALARGLAMVRRQTGGTDGLTIRIAKPLCVEVERLLRLEGWGERFGLGNSDEAIVWLMLAPALREGLARFRLRALPAVAASQLAWVAKQARHLPKWEAGPLRQGGVDRHFNAARASNPVGASGHAS